MQALPDFLIHLELDASADEMQVKRAYARLLKQIDQEQEPERFQRLRQHYEAALQYVRMPSIPDEWVFGLDRPFKEDEPDTTSVDSPAPSPSATEQAGDKPTQQADFKEAAARQLQALRDTLSESAPALFELAQLQKVLSGLLERDDLLGLEAREAFEIELLNGILDRRWGAYAGPLFCAGNRCFAWTNSAHYLSQSVAPHRVLQLDLLLLELLQLDLPEQEGWCALAKIPNPNASLALLTIEENRKTCPGLSQLFFDPPHLARLKADSEEEGRLFDQFAGNLRDVANPSIADVESLLRQYTHAPAMEVLLVHAIASQRFEQLTRVVTAASMRVFNWNDHNAQGLLKFGEMGRQLAAVIQNSYGEDWTRYMSAETARQIRRNLKQPRPIASHRAEQTTPSDRDTRPPRCAWCARFLALFIGGGVWEPIGVLAGFGLVFGLIVFIVSFIPSQQIEKNLAQCDLLFAHGIDTNWEKINTLELNKLRTCVEQLNRPTLCADRKSLKGLLTIQTILGSEARADPFLPLIFRPAPDRLYDYVGQLSCEQHDRLVFSTGWLHLPDKAAIAKSVRALGACSVQPSDTAELKTAYRYRDQNTVLLRKAMTMTTEWREGAGQGAAKGIALNDFLNTPIDSSRYSSGLSEMLLLPEASCVSDPGVGGEALRVAKTGPNETRAIMDRGKRK